MDTNNRDFTKKPAILKAALKLFAMKGIKATTIKNIAQEAGVAEGTIYRHWKSKGELTWDKDGRDKGDRTPLCLCLYYWDDNQAL